MDGLVFKPRVVLLINELDDPDSFYPYLPLCFTDPRDVHDPVHVPRDDSRFSPDFLDDVW